jgi:phage gp37-like protein
MSGLITRGLGGVFRPAFTGFSFEDIEDALLTALRESIPYLRTVKTYAGELEADIEKLSIPFPAAFVVYGGSDFDLIDGPGHQESATFSVLAAARSLRSGERARKQDHGAYDIITEVKAALTNRRLGLDMEKLRPLRTYLVYTGRTVVVYGTDFGTSFDSAYQW